MDKLYAVVSLSTIDGMHMSGDVDGVQLRPLKLDVTACMLLQKFHKIFIGR